MPSPSCHLAASSREQAYDWSLVLASQGVESTIHSDESGWALLVEEADGSRAMEVLRLYQRENRGWLWRQQIRGADVLFHAGSILWCLVLILAYVAACWRWPGLQARGMVDSPLVFAGEWWRLGTAVLLHGHLAHLAGNITTGLILFGLAMGRFGGGPALLASYLAGLLGNLASCLLCASPHRSLGASGMVMGALGLLAVPAVISWWRHPRALDLLWRAGGGAACLLFLTGLSPGTDIVAHVGGFVAGAGLGMGLSLLPDRFRQHAAASPASLGLLLGMIFWTWLQALAP